MPAKPLPRRGTFSRRVAPFAPLALPLLMGSVGSSQRAGRAASASVSAPTPNLGPFVAGCNLPMASADHHAIDDGCPIEGDHPNDPKESARSRAKNDFCAPDPATPITYETLKALENALGSARNGDLSNRPALLSKVLTQGGTTYGEGMRVQYVGYVMDAHYSNATISKGKAGEVVNCHEPGGEMNDIHIPLGQTPTDEPCISVTAEMSPHGRPASWTPEHLNALGVHPIRVTGHLFFDDAHHACTPQKPQSPPRASVWEVHPVYAVDICKKTTLTDCAVDSTNWVAWDDWVGVQATEAANP